MIDKLDDEIEVETVQTAGWQCNSKNVVLIYVNDTNTFLRLDHIIH